MLSIEDLRFSQKFPFTKTSKRIIKEFDFSLSEIPEPVISRAKLMVVNALSDKNYEPHIGSSSELLKNEVLAFPLAKIFVSIIDSDDAFRKFARMFGKNVFLHLEKESDDVLFLLAKELGIKFELLFESNYFASVLVLDFLSANVGGHFKLVNQKVGGGKVFLSKNEFVRFVSFAAQKQLLDSLPVDASGVPKYLRVLAKEISAQAFESKKGQFKGMVFGSVKPEFFPPCIEKLYADILAGRNLSHMERFVLATFMISIGMSVEQVIELYSRTPNFDKKITTYQVTRLAGEGGTRYSAASCSKMAEYKLRLPTCPCMDDKRVKHPVQVYQSGVFKK